MNYIWEWLYGHPYDWMDYGRCYPDSYVIKYY